LYARLANKGYQRELALLHGIPIPSGEKVESRTDLLKAFRNRYSKTGAFVTSLEPNWGGIGCSLVETYEELEDDPKFRRDCSAYLILTKLCRACSPNGMGIVAGPDEVFVCTLSDQFFSGGINGTSHAGNFFPSTASSESAREIMKQTKKIGQVIASMGYRGFFGVDYVVDTQGRVYMAEINPRKQSSTPQSMFLLAPEINLGELELRAIRDGTFGKVLTDMPPLETCCALREVKAQNELVLNEIADNGTGRRIFEANNGATLLTSYLSGTRIGIREQVGSIISVGKIRDKVKTDLEDLEKRVQTELKV
jgi:predicted ATP-grasp superfamily ATP-dependent carboligase